MLALLSGGLGIPAAAAQPHAASDEQKRVIAIYSTRRDSLLADAAERAITPQLESAWGTRLDYYTEYIDPVRFRDETFAGFSQFIQRKYPGLRPDLVLAFEDAAIEFLRRYRDTVFPGTPVVFFTRDAAATRLPNSTGVIEPIDFTRSVELITALQPDVDQVFVVSGASARDRFYEAAARAQLQALAARPRLTYLSGLPIDQLEARLASLPPHSAVLPLMVSQSGDDTFLKPQDVMERLVTIANQPVYGWNEPHLGMGVVGGGFLQLAPGLAEVGLSANRVLSGESADGIAVSRPHHQQLAVDARALRRWGIDESRVPPQFAIAFAEPTAWQRYRPYLLAAAVVVLAQSLLIGGLLIQARRRRLAENELRQSQAALKNSYDRVRDLGGRLLTAQEAERSRIARDLHDDITQQMAALAVELYTVGGTESARQHLERITQSVHDLSHRLHPEALRALGLVGALRSLQQEHARAGVPVTFTYGEIPKTIAPALTVNIFRVAQEALQNAIKYSQASAIAIDLRCAADALALTITDNGIGFDVETSWGRGLGLISIQERVESAGGSVSIESSPGRGTRFLVRVPIESAAVA